MAAKKTVAQQQLEDLRVLQDLKASGELSEKDFRAQKAKIMDRSLEDEPGPGPVSSAVLRRSRSVFPAWMKGLIALAVLAVFAVIVWQLVDLSVFRDAFVDRAPRQPQEEPTQAVAPEADPPSTTGGEQANQPQQSIFSDTPEEESQAPVTPAHGDADATEQQPAQAPNEQDGTEPAAPQIPNDLIPWPVPYDDQPVDASHPFHGKSDRIKVIRDPAGRALIGVTRGPRAISLDDPVYLAFRDGLRSAFVSAYSGAADGADVLNNAAPMIVNGIRTDRCTIVAPNQRVMRALVTTVHDGYCFAYWFDGAKAAYREFTQTVGEARPDAQAPDAPPAAQDAPEPAPQTPIRR